MLRILMVDDEPDLDLLIQQRFRKKVKEGQMSLTFARHGLEAIEHIDHADAPSQRPHIVITDLNMPEMNGLELLIHIKKMRPEILVYIVSAYSDQDSVRTAKNAGADGFLFKPLNFSELDEIVDAHL